MGFILGTLIGGRYSDRAVKKWIVRRDGIRYVRGLGGKDDSIAWLILPIVSAFVIAAGLLAAFASLNTYCGGRSFPII